VTSDLKAPPLFVFVKVSSLGPAIKRFNRDVVAFLRREGLEFSDVYSSEELRGFAPDPIVVEHGVPRISELAYEFVRVTGLGFGDVYPDLLAELPVSGRSLSDLDLASDDLDEEENVA
jgi:hypothetical protein